MRWLSANLGHASAAFPSAMSRRPSSKSASAATFAVLPWARASRGAAAPRTNAHRAAAGHTRFGTRMVPPLLSHYRSEGMSSSRFALTGPFGGELGRLVGRGRLVCAAGTGTTGGGVVGTAADVTVVAPLAPLTPVAGGAGAAALPCAGTGGSGGAAAAVDVGTP